MKRNLVLTVGDVRIEEEVYSGFIGGKIIAINEKTGETYETLWNRKHNKNNKIRKITEALSAVAPKSEEKVEPSDNEEEPLDK